MDASPGDAGPVSDAGPDLDGNVSRGEDAGLGTDPYPGPCAIYSGNRIGEYRWWELLAYDDQGRVKSIMHRSDEVAFDPVDTIFEYRTDPDGILETETKVLVGGELVKHGVERTNSEGRVLSWSDLLSGISEQIGYRSDHLEQWSERTGADGSVIIRRDYTYTFDAMGRVTTQHMHVSPASATSYNVLSIHLYERLPAWSGSALLDDAGVETASGCPDDELWPTSVACDPHPDARIVTRLLHQDGLLVHRHVQNLGCTSSVDDFEYDAQGRLLRRQHLIPVHVNGCDFDDGYMPFWEYMYDDAGNLRHMTFDNDDGGRSEDDYDYSCWDASEPDLSPGEAS